MQKHSLHLSSLLSLDAYSGEPSTLYVVSQTTQSNSVFCALKDTLQVTIQINESSTTLKKQSQWQILHHVGSSRVISHSVPSCRESAPHHCIHNHKSSWDPPEVGLIPRLRVCSTLTAASSWRIPVGRRRERLGWLQPRHSSLTAKRARLIKRQWDLQCKHWELHQRTTSGQLSFHDKNHIYFNTEMCICISLELN